MTTETLKIDAALGGVMDRIGEMIVRGGEEDASGARRCFLNFLVEPNYEKLRLLAPGITDEEIDELRAAAVEEFGPPE